MGLEFNVRCSEGWCHIHQPSEELFGQGASQLHAIDHIINSVREVGKPPTDLTSSGALNMLRAAEGYTDEPAVGSLCTFNLEKVSIPDPGWSPIPLDKLWGPGGCEFVDDRGGQTFEGYGGIKAL